MAAVLTNIGEEFNAKNSLEGTFTVLLYNDSTDAASDTTDLSDITTEPTDGNYARQSTSFGAAKLSGDWGTANSAGFSFDLTGAVNTAGGIVDAYAIIANFTSTEAGDSTATDHIISTGLLSQNRDLAQIDTLDIAADSVGFSVN